MELAMQIIYNEENVKINTVENLKDFKFQSVAAQAKKGEQLVSMMPAIKKIDLMGDDIVDLPTENDSLKNNIGSYNEKWIQESKTKLFKQIDDEKRENIFY